MDVKQIGFEKGDPDSKEEVNNNFCSIKDLEFTAACQEQYSRRSYIRIFNIKEKGGVCVDVCVENLKFLNIDIDRKDIDIVHRV